MIYFLKDIKQSLHFWLLRRKASRIWKNADISRMTEPVDFVVTWVDGNDPVWQSRRREVEQKLGITQQERNNGQERYRDWDLFRYWFRAVERYAPWVRTVWLITADQVPSWLNTEAPKLKLVSHRDYIPAENLPTFNSNVIELNMHRIDGLAEHFVYFNDDMFLMRPCCPEDFFRGGCSNHCAVAQPLRNPDNGGFYHHQFSVLGAINRIYGGHVGDTISAHPDKWFFSGYGNEMLYNKYAAQLDFLPGMFFSHLPVPMRKSTFEQVWSTFPDLMKETSAHPFRKPEDMMHQIMSVWEIMEGDFCPVTMDHYGRVFSTPHQQMEAILQTIGREDCLSVCINDSEYISEGDYQRVKECIRLKMEEVFPEKSSFER